MPQLTPNEILAKWKRNAANSVDSYKAGVMAVQESPTEQAAAKADDYLKGVRESIESGKWQSGLRAITLDAWKQAAVGVGAERLATGVKKGERKMATFLQEFIPFQRDLQRQVRSMPKSTVEEREARMLAMARGTRRFVRTGLGRIFEGQGRMFGQQFA